MAKAFDGGVVWPLRPDGSEVPAHRRSWTSLAEGQPVFCASDYRKTVVNGKAVGHWQCGYCTKISTDTLSPHRSDTLTSCTKCGKTNRISI